MPLNVVVKLSGWLRELVDRAEYGKPTSVLIFHYFPQHIEKYFWIRPSQW